jgi:hypothetical protein
MAIHSKNRSFTRTWKQPLAEMQGNAAYRRPKVVGPCASSSYVHRAALLVLKIQKLRTCHLLFQSTLPSMERPDLGNRQDHVVDCQVPDIT